MTANTNGNNSSRRMKSPTRRFSSPGGLTTPANWNATGLAVNIDDLNINDVDMSYDSSNNDALNNINTPTNYDNPYSYNQSNNNNTDHDIKPIDLSVYKEKLLKKMTMGLSNSPANLTQSLPQLQPTSGQRDSMSKNNKLNNNSSHPGVLRVK
jgi:hypothetical protein